jgi:hypothetical protein
VVIKGEISGELRNSAELYAGCVSGAINEEEYLNIIKQSGFRNVEIKKRKRIEISDETLSLVLSEKELHDYNNSLNSIYSITVIGTKN